MLLIYDSLLRSNLEVTHLGLCYCFNLSADNSSRYRVCHLSNRCFEVTLEGNISGFIYGSTAKIIFLVHKSDFTRKRSSVYYEYNTTRHRKTTMYLNHQEIHETIRMIRDQNLDIRTITMGISLYDCVSDSADRLCEKIYDKITKSAEHLCQTGEEIEKLYGIPIINKRVSVTPISLIAGGIDPSRISDVARTMDRAAKTLGINFIGGYSALVQKGSTKAADALIESIPEALSETDVVCSSVNLASTKAGINMDKVKRMGEIIRETALAEGIPIMEDKPLARALYAKGKVEDFIPDSLIEPVAEVLKWAKQIQDARKEEEELDSVTLEDL